VARGRYHRCMTTTLHLQTYTLLLPLLLTLAGAVTACGGSNDTGGGDNTADSSGVDLSGSDAFDVGSAVGWTRNFESVPSQILMVFGAWEMNCEVFTTWDPSTRHFPVLGDGGFVYTQLYVDEEPATGLYDKIEGDPSCYDQDTFETICDHMISFAQWGEISKWDGDGTDADFQEVTNDAKAPSVTLDRADTDRFTGSFNYDGSISGTFDVPNCGDGLY
jgi:hypothetical protein